MLLEIKDLHLCYAKAPILNGVNLHIDTGEILGLVGASGSGKSSIAQSILDLTSVKPHRGKILLNGENLLQKSLREMGKIRGCQIGFISQHVMTALHPMITIGKQITETIFQHKKISYHEAKTKAQLLLEKVKLPISLQSYPHELSGGMRQRVMIAIAISCDPKLLIADEPTTALDNSTQAEILSLLNELKLPTLFITHNLKLASRFCNRVSVMHEGRIIETGFVEQIFSNPKHSITQKLLQNKTFESQKRPQIAKPLVEMKCLKKEYGNKKVIENATFTLYQSETVGLTGKSGCGKSTLCKILLKLISPTSGSITYYTSKIQIIFQDPHGSLNPRMKINEIISEALVIHSLPKENRFKLMDLVELPKTLLNRYPHELSGGQKQRVGIARAISVLPELIICDEPLSSLDANTQDQILELLLNLQNEMKLSYLFISHDLDLLKEFASRILVMSEGRITD